MPKAFFLFLFVGVSTSVVQAIDAEKADWFVENVFNPYGPLDDPEGKKKYASFFTEDAIVCSPNGYDECHHGRVAIESRPSLPFTKAHCNAIRPLTNDGANAITFDWVCALDYGHGCIGSHHGRGYMEFDEHDKIKKSIGFAHPEYESSSYLPACFTDKKQDL